MNNAAQLIGSGKQIAWAESIRDSVMNALLKAGSEAGAADKSRVYETMSWLCDVADSRFWIEMRAGLVDHSDLSRSPAIAFVCTTKGRRQIAEIARKFRLNVPVLPALAA